MKLKVNEKGVMLFMVLGTLLVVTLLINAVLSFVLSHYRQSFHQLHRIQAYYAALAGVNLAMERLRNNNTNSTYSLCSSGCLGADDINDGDIPYRVNITITNSSGNYTINAAVDYTSSL